MFEKRGQRISLRIIRFVLFLDVVISGSIAPRVLLAQPSPQGNGQEMPVETAASPASIGVVLVEDIPARKQALSERLENLRKANLPKEKLEEVEAAFGRVLKMLTDLQETTKQQEAYIKSAAEIPQRLQEAAAQQQAEEKAKTPEFEQYTDDLRSEYADKLKNLQGEIENLMKESSQGDIRITRIAEEIKELEARSIELGDRLQKLGYSTAQTQTAPETNAPMSEAQEVALERQLVRAQVDTLEAERNWLTKRRPLQDRLLALARLRAANTERDLGIINQGLLETIQSRRAKLKQQLADVEKEMTESQSRGETLLLAVRHKTIEIQMKTLDYSERSKGLRSELLKEEKLTTRMNQDKDRLIALMEKYGAGEWVAQRVMVDLQKFQREGEREIKNAVPEAKVEEALRTANKRLFEIGNEIFGLDDQSDQYQRELTQLQLPPDKLRSLKSEARQLIEDQKQALQKQEEVLTERVQALNKLIELNRQQESLVKGLYSFVLTRILWLRNREPLGPYPVNFDRFRIAGDAGISYARRVYVYTRSASVERLREEVRGSPLPYIVFGIFFLLLPVGAIMVRRRARSELAALLEKSADSDTPPGIKSFALLTLSTAIWPAYIFLFVLVRSWFVADLDPVVYAFRDVLRLTALVLWVLMFSQQFLKQQGWAMQYWRLTPEACRLLRWTLRIGCYAAFLFMVPRFAILRTPELGGTVEASLALARILMISFQLALLVLAAFLLRRNSSFTRWLLGRSHQQHEILWQIWPILYLPVLALIAGIVCLDVLGYQYAAEFFWQRSVTSLLVVVLLWAVFIMGRGLITTLGHRQAARAGALDANERVVKWLVALLGILLFFASVAAVLEVWGLSVLELMATPLGTTLLERGLFIAAAIAGAGIVIYLTNAVVMSLLRPKILAEGRTREAGRKLQTLGPLVETIVRVTVILIAILVVLGQVGVQTGPLLAGVGIFGLAIGFAAQSLIKDIINGLFILFEGSLAVGDIVNLGGIGGQVEKVTLRSVRVRDLGGNVHFIPNSTIERVENMTKDFSRYLMDVGVAYREDTDEVVQVMKEVDEEMRKDPMFKWDMLEPIEVLGVDRFADSAVVVKARLKTRPMQQWRTGREYNRRLKKAFDKRGIEIPFPHRTVYWGETKQGQRPLQVDVDSRRPEVTVPVEGDMQEEASSQELEGGSRKNTDRQTGT